MDISSRIKAFSNLGEKIKGLDVKELEHVKEEAQRHNPWFIPEFVEESLSGITHYLNDDKLKEWASKYQFESNSKKVGIVLAGNIPAVGFHDLLCVLISGHTAVLKLSSKDSYLIKTIISWLRDLAPSLEKNIEYSDRLNHVDAVIATGSDNTARYFKYYFGDRPHIIRQNRTAVAVLEGNESDAQLLQLSSDIFLYFGLGCRNVSKLFVPKGYDLIHFLDIINQSDYAYIIDNTKYRNNYDYNKSIYLVNKEEHLDSGLLLLKESNALVSPTAVLFYQFYENRAQLQLDLAQKQEKIQCIVSSCAWIDDAIPPGKAQFPELDNYADGVDTMEFLAHLH